MISLDANGEPLKRIVSDSQDGLFRKCPRAWYLYRVARAEKAPAASLVLGRALHEAIEEDGRRHRDGKPRMGLDEILVFGEAALDHELGDAFAHETVLTLTAKLQAILRAYMRDVQARFRPIAVEEPIDPPLPIPGTSWSFTGRVDARLPKRVLDFKSSSKPWDENAADDKPQARAYLWAARQLDWDATSVTFVVFPVTGSLETGFVAQTQYRSTFPTPSQVQGYEKRLVTLARDIDRALERETFPARPQPLCGGCEYLHRCALGRMWLAQRNRTPWVPVLPIVMDLEDDDTLAELEDHP